MLPSQTSPPWAKGSHVHTIMYLLMDAWSVCNLLIETLLSYGCCWRRRQAHLPSTHGFLASVLFSYNLQSSPGVGKDVSVKGLVIFHPALISLTSLMQWDPGLFSGSGRGMRLLGLIFIPSANGMPASSPKQAFGGKFSLL